MPSRILSDREVEQLASWPEDVARSDLSRRLSVWYVSCVALS